MIQSLIIESSKERINKMKAYIITIELKESNPLIWRSVIMPADATYKRLHDTIQTVTNFQGGYPSDGYHLYEFNLIEENIKVTNNEEAYLEYQNYKKNKAVFKKRLETMPDNMRVFEQKYQGREQAEVRKPSGLKIDGYLEKYKEINYVYDYGDNWNFTIKLEKIVDDYYFGYPTLLDGAGTAPPEDVGGMDNFYEFLEIYRNPNHPDHEDTKAWADSFNFREYDFEWINHMLKMLNYKKTEWDKINHVGYVVVNDKYRKK